MDYYRLGQDDARNRQHESPAGLTAEQLRDWQSGHDFVMRRFRIDEYLERRRRRRRELEEDGEELPVRGR